MATTPDTVPLKVFVDLEVRIATRLSDHDEAEAPAGERSSWLTAAAGAGAALYWALCHAPRPWSPGQGNPPPALEAAWQAAAKVFGSMYPPGGEVRELR